MRVNENILISSLTTMNLGGATRYVLEVESPSDVADAYGFAAQFNIPTYPLGYGANTIGHDEGFPGAIIINRMQGITEEITPEGTVRLKIMGGQYWDDVVDYSVQKGLTGIEALSKIPGLAGSAPVQNIGAYGQEIADTLESIEVYDTISGTFKTLSHDDLNFSYRHSILNTTEFGRYFVISITLVLKPGEMTPPLYQSIETYAKEHNITSFSPKNVRDIVSAIRADKLPDPLKQASAGSFFKNIYLSEEETETALDKGYPVHRGKDGNKINSGWFISEAGLAGLVLHGFKISEKAPLVLINESATSYNDLSAARAEITSKVYDKFGYWLEQEPVEIPYEDSQR